MTTTAAESALKIERYVAGRCFPPPGTPISSTGVAPVMLPLSSAGMKVGGGINLVGGQSKSEGPFALEGGAVLEQASAQGISEKSGDVG